MKQMNRLHQLFSAGVVAALGVAFAPSASARSVAAWGGHPLSPGSSSCFTESYATVTNSTCNASVGWEINLPVDAAGTWNVTINATPTSDLSSVSCVVYGTSASASTLYESAASSPTQPSVAQSLQVFTVEVPSAGALYAGCFLKEGAKVNSVNWNQPLQVPLDPQTQSNWCWAASGQMILNYFGGTVTQCDEATEYLILNNPFDVGTDCCSSPLPSGCNLSGFVQWSYLGLNFTETPKGTALSFAQLQTEMSANRPVGFGWAWDSGGGHYMVAIGAETGENNAQFVTINDPDPVNAGDQVTLTYAEWVNTPGTSTHWSDDYGISPK
jgi:hypothetical protein